jgi:hypothetical protein
MARSRRGDVMDPAKLIGLILHSLGTTSPCAPLPLRQGVFLPHGCVYRESGGLLELGAADTRSPLEAVRQSALLRHVVADALDRVEQQSQVQDFVASQHNTAYTTHNLQHATAGHFNITRYRHATAYLPALAALLAALPALSGGGGFDLRNLQFVLSIRSLRCERLLSNKTQSDRGAIDTKPMPASHGERQQIMNVDNLQSHKQTRAVFTLLHLFYVCTEHSDSSGPRIELIAPIDDMHRMIRGPRFDHRFQTAGGAQLKATEILLRFLDWYTELLPKDWMPSWAEAEIKLTRELVRRLDAEGLEGAVGTADHATLYHLWQTALAEHGLDAELAERARLRLVQMAKAQTEGSVLQDSAQYLVNCADALEGEIGCPSHICTDYAAAARAFIRLAYEFGDIRHGGLYAQLVASGVASEGVLFDAAHLAQHANSPVPEREGRAAARSRVILKLHTEGVAADSYATWDYVATPTLGELNLRDYAESRTDHWVKAAAPSEKKPLSDTGFSALQEYLQLHETGRIREHGTTRPLIETNEEGVIGFCPYDDDDDLPF